jgi:AcrR family transcriptional regulator
MTPPPDTRDRLIEAARTLFLRQGYSATGIAQILREAEARSGSLYHFFPTKEDLLIAVLERYLEMLGPAVMEPVFNRVSDPVERIFGVLDGYRQMLRITGCTQGCPIGNLALELSDTHPAVRELIAANFTNWRRAIEQCLLDARDRLPADTDPEQLAAFVLTVMEGGIMQAKAYRSLDAFETAVAQLRDHFDRLLADGTDWSAPRTSTAADNQAAADPSSSSVADDPQRLGKSDRLAGKGMG